ncbi:unnamed protein product [Caenorhabditis angaria]|uniref:DUF19 domain-containing protein n=1 Tax=Caenorhabditis angaria TaxID=860376 RepID=A0A9P1I9G7_9PELO|nr:unnamed protein product [Caenorhabditis angaria]
MISKIIFLFCFLNGFAHNFPTDQNCGLKADLKFRACLKVFELETKSSKNSTTIWESTKNYNKCIETLKPCKKFNQSALFFTLISYSNYIREVFGNCLNYDQEIRETEFDCKFLGEDLKNYSIQSMKDKKCGEIERFLKIHDEMLHTVGCEMS